MQKLSRDIIHDFGISTYSRDVWNKLTPEQWEELLLHLAAQPYLVEALGKFRDSKMGWGEDKLTQVYQPLITLLTTKMPRNYFTRLPSGLRHMLFGYLRSSRQGETRLCGVLHSFNGAPSVHTASGYDDEFEENWLWHNFGKLHRVDGPARIVATERFYIGMSWSINGEFARHGPGVKSICYSLHEDSWRATREGTDEEVYVNEEEVALEFGREMSRARAFR